jgi:hypothetical protein
MPPDLFGSTGPLTGAFEELATSIGAGAVVGSFLAGIFAFASSRSRERLERWPVTGGYVGGGLALLLLAVDILRKHFV